MEKLVRLICTLDLRNVEIDDAVMDGLAEGIVRLRPRDPPERLAEFIPGARTHAHPSLRLYEDYRRHLLKNPMGR